MVVYLVVRTLVFCMHAVRLSPLSIVVVQWFIALCTGRNMQLTFSPISSKGRDEEESQAWETFAKHLLNCRGSWQPASICVLYYNMTSVFFLIFLSGPLYHHPLSLSLSPSYSDVTERKQQTFFFPRSRTLCFLTDFWGGSRWGTALGPPPFERRENLL